MIHPIVLILSAAALTLVPAASASHLAMPESALFHNGKIYVSLIGDPLDNDGAVVTVDSTGKVTGTLVRASRAKPLIDPTGMAIKGSTLWVNDGTRIRSYSLKTRAPGRVVAIPPGSAITIARSVVVNDLAIDRRGNLWASGSETRSLYRVSAARRVTRFRLPKSFRGLPNGVALHPSGDIWFVTFNESAVGGAQVGRVTAAGTFTEVMSSPRLRQLDGLVFVGRTAYISDFGNGSIWKLSANGTLTRRAVLAGSPADISYAPALKRLLIPLIQRGHLTTLKP
jgi:sugar lactone lactonase YvrE